MTDFLIKQAHIPSGRHRIIFAILLCNDCIWVIENMMQHSLNWTNKRSISYWLVCRLWLICFSINILFSLYYYYYYLSSYYFFYIILYYLVNTIIQHSLNYFLNYFLDYFLDYFLVGVQIGLGVGSWPSNRATEGSNSR